MIMHNMFEIHVRATMFHFMIFVAVNLSASSFGQDDYTHLMSDLSVSTDWKNIIGETSYRTLAIHNREFANLCANTSYPNVPFGESYNVRRKGETSFVSYSVEGSVELFTCLDTGLVSRCSYMTKLNLGDNFNGTANVVYSVVTKNVNNTYNLSDWLTRSCTDNSALSGNDFLVAPTGLVDIIDKNNKKTYATGDTVSTVTNSNKIEKCSKFSNIVYASTIVHDSIYPISPLCYMDDNLGSAYMQAYAQPNGDSNTTAICNNVSYALYDDPGFILGGPVALEIFNVWRDMNVVISGFVTDPLVTNIDFLPDVARMQLAYLHKNVTTEFNTISIASYADAQSNLTNIIKNVTNMYGAGRLTLNTDIQLNFPIGNDRIMFIHTSTNAAKYITQDPLSRDQIVNAADVLGQTLAATTPQYLKTKHYCVGNKQVYVDRNVISQLDMMVGSAHNSTYNKEILNNWRTAFGSLLTSCALAGLVPIIIPAIGGPNWNTVVMTLILLILVVCASTIINGINYHNANISYDAPSTVIGSYASNNTNIIVSVARVTMRGKIKDGWYYAGWILSAFAFLCILIVNAIAVLCA